jgi:hypothetical protein
MFIEDSIEGGTRWSVFEPNGEPLSAALPPAVGGWTRRTRAIRMPEQARRAGDLKTRSRGRGSMNGNAVIAIRVLMGGGFWFALVALTGVAVIVAVDIRWYLRDRTTANRRRKL